MFYKFMTIVVVACFAGTRVDGYSELRNEETKDEAEFAVPAYDHVVATWPSKISEGWYNIPRNLTQAKSEGWIEVEGASESPLIKAYAYKGDPRYIAKYSNITEMFTGYQIGVLVKDLVGVPIDYDNHIGITKKKINNEEYYTGSVMLFENPKGVRQIWVEYNSTWYEQIPIYADLIPATTRYEKKKCIPTMADPHYYAMNSTTNCSNISPWFVIRRGKYTVGVGFQIIGTATPGPDRTWYEHLTAEGLKDTIPDAPQCVISGLSKYGVASTHTWFIKDPWNIDCSKENLPPSKQSPRKSCRHER